MFSHITHPTDRTEEGRAAFALALALAIRAQGRLRAVHVPRGVPTWSPSDMARELTSRWSRPGGDRLSDTTLAVGSGHVWGALLGDLEAHPPSLMVLATSAVAGWSRWTTQRVAEPLVRAGRVPSLVVPHGARPLHDEATGRFLLGRVLMPVAVRPSAARARALVDGLAALSDDTTFVRELSVGDAQPPPFRTSPPPPGLSVEKVRQPGDASVVDTVLAQVASWRPDLVVLTSRGHDSPVDALFGSLTEQVLRRAGVAVLVVPAAR